MIEPPYLPVAKGLQESVHKFEKLEEEIELVPLLGQLAARPPLEVAIAEDTQAMLPALAGGLSVALAHSFRIVDPETRNPQTHQWEVVFRVFDLLL